MSESANEIIMLDESPSRRSDRDSPSRTGQDDSKEGAMGEVEKFTKKIEEERLILIKPANSECTFKVSESLLCQCSDYFVKAVQGAFKEASTATLTLPGASLDTVRLFIYWLYHRRLPLFSWRIPIQDSAAEQILLVQLWVFGESVLIPDLQDAAMRTLMDYIMYSTIEVDAIKEAFLTTAKGSLLRNFMVEETIGTAAHHHSFWSEKMADRLSSIPGFWFAYLEFEKAGQGISHAETIWPTHDCMMEPRHDTRGKWLVNPICVEAIVHDGSIDPDFD